MYEAAGRQRKATTVDTSLGSPRRPAGVWDIIASTILFPPSTDSCNNVRILVMVAKLTTQTILLYLVGMSGKRNFAESSKVC